MNNYRRFVSYMYNYEKKIKKNNVGFARVETKEDECKVTIHIQVKTISNGNIKVYGVYRNEIDFLAIPLGEITFKNGRGDGQIVTKLSDVGNSEIGFDKIGGLIVYLADDKYFGTEWDDKPLIFNEFHLFEKKQPLNKAVENQPVLNQPLPNQSVIKAAEIKLETEKEEIKEVEPKEVESKEEEISNNCIGMCEETCRFEPYTLSQLFEKFSYTVTEDFMLHGYCRFGHLGVMKKEDIYILGVPGVFCKREEMIANRAGFHNFYNKKRRPLKYGDFGYWYTNMEYLK